MATSFSSIPLAATTARPAERRRFLFSPLVDFLTFGGLSLLVLPAMLLLPANDAVVGQTAFITLMLASVLNHPHFAHSYQLFYRQFADKASGRTLNPVMRARYLFAGIAAPLLLIAFLAYGFFTRDVKLLGYAGNFMVLTVGWHYVKQGYGLLMTDCALKRQFFGDTDKKVLLANCYATWGATWLLFNADGEIAGLQGIAYQALALPGWLVNAGMGAAFATTLAAVAVFLRAARTAGKLPLNGVMAYLASLYPWLLLVKLSSLWVLTAPAFHSLQYLAVVWRLELNREQAQQSAQAARAKVLRHFAGFVGLGLLLGFLGFYGLPWLADRNLSYDTGLFGPTFFMFAAWIFINVHHYFIDNVIWRRDNPDAQKYLFS